MFLIIFPKGFEYYKFIYQLINSNIFLIKFPFNQFEIIICQINKRNYIFCVKLINSSDIDFLLKLNTFLTILQERTFKIVLFGTCGYFGNTHNIGDAFFCTKAIKFDRGFLDDNGFNIDKNKILYSYCDIDDGKIVLSSNFLLISKKEKCLHIFKDIVNDNLVDMETFDFIKICQNNNYIVKGVIRIISDILDGSNNKIDRLSCSFKNGCEKFIELLISEKDNINESFGYIKEITIKYSNLLFNPYIIKSITNSIETKIRNDFEKYLKTEEKKYLEFYTNLEKIEKWKKRKQLIKKKIGDYFLIKNPCYVKIKDNNDNQLIFKKRKFEDASQ